MEILQTIVAALVALGILVTIHEYGHFWVARRCGVKVLRFSVGFGKPLYRWYDKHGTEFAIAAIPLGGYVKMLDEREGNVPSSLRHQAFNQKTTGQRIAIAAAGPIVNLLFAVFAYWFLFMAGESKVVPVIGQVQVGSPAAQAQVMTNTEIIAVDGYKTRSWEEVNLRLAARLGETGSISLQTQDVDTGRLRAFNIPLTHWEIDEEQGPISSVGLMPYVPELPARIGQVVPESAAEQGGLLVGDLVVSVNGETIDNWMGLVKLVQNSPGKSLSFELQRDGQYQQLVIIPGDKRMDDGRVVGYMGAAPSPIGWPPEMIREVQYSPVAAMGAALAKTGQMIELILESIYKMVQGLISVKNLSGPITIAKVASASAESGLETFVNFLAYLSISLGVLNLLPIPMLDGGHLLYYFIEAVRGKPVSERVQLLGLKFGMALLLSLMTLALYNDLLRL